VHLSPRSIDETPRAQLTEVKNKNARLRPLRTGKFVVQGREGLAAMQQLCAADVDTAAGKLSYTGMLNGYGGYELDCTVTRLAEQQFFVVSGTATAVRDLSWMQRQIQALGLDA
jgi:glycine cleavage system aminomethyltransferase T